MRYPLANAYLQLHGVDPHMVLENGLYSDGFYSLTPSDIPNPIREHDGHSVYLHKWPAGCNYREVVQRMDMDAKGGGFERPQMEWERWVDWRINPTSLSGVSVSPDEAWPAEPLEDIF